LYALVTHLQHLKEEFDKQDIKIIQQTENVFLLAQPRLQTDYTIERDWFDLHMMVRLASWSSHLLRLKTISSRAKGFIS
jgi:hypothetical protein